MWSIMATVSLSCYQNRIGVNARVESESRQNTYCLPSLTVNIQFLGGLKVVLLTDFFQFLHRNGFGAFAAAYYILDLPPGLVYKLNLFDSDENVAGKLWLLRFLWPKLLIFLYIYDANSYSVRAATCGIQEQSQAAEGLHLRKRNACCQDEKNAIGATLFFNIAHYGFRPWAHWIFNCFLAFLIVLFQMSLTISAAFPIFQPIRGEWTLAYSAIGWPSCQLASDPICFSSWLARWMIDTSTHFELGIFLHCKWFLLKDFWKAQEATDKTLVAVERSRL